MKVTSRAEAKAQGQTRYFTGAPCLHGHLCERLTSNSNCVKCLKDVKQKWRTTNPEGQHLTRERRREWRATKAGKRSQRVRTARYHAHKIGAVGYYTVQDVDALLGRQPECVGCGVSFALAGYTVDHVVPLSRGGSNWPDNLQLLCQPCNSSKGDKFMCEWVREAA